jgi:hypothetical protein
LGGIFIFRRREDNPANEKWGKRLSRRAGKGRIVA